MIHVKPQVQRLCRALLKLSDDAFYGTVEVKFVNGVPEQTRITRQYRDGELPLVAEGRLAELLG